MTEALHATIIERDLLKGQKFLRGTSINKRIRWKMLDVGYTDEVHRRGWELYLRVMGRDENPLAVLEAVDAETKASIKLVDDSDENLYTLIHLALDARYPDAAKKLFAGVEAKQGFDAVVCMELFFTHVDELRAGSESERAALALVVTRNLLSPEREHALRQAVKAAKGPAAPALPTPSDEYQRAAQEFHLWLTEWRGTAAVVITRRDDRILLGLTKRRTTKTAEPGAEPQIEVEEEEVD